MTAGYQPAFDKLKGQLCAAYGLAIQVIGGPGRAEAFEVYADGQVLHSKLNGSGGKVDTAGVPLWTEAECKALTAKLKPFVRA